MPIRTKTVTKNITITPTKSTVNRVPTTVWKTERLTVTTTKTLTTQIGCYKVTVTGVPITVTQTVTNIKTSTLTGKEVESQSVLFTLACRTINDINATAFIIVAQLSHQPQ